MNGCNDNNCSNYHDHNVVNFELATKVVLCSNE